MEKMNVVEVKFYNYNGISYATWRKDEVSYSYQNANGEVNETELRMLSEQL